jgi:hypothetical protein
MPGVMGELGEERPLGAAVALAERVQGVDVSEEPARVRRYVAGGWDWEQERIADALAG